MEIITLIFVSLAVGMLFGILESIHRYAELILIVCCVIVIIAGAMMLGDEAFVSSTHPFWYYFISVPCIMLGSATGKSIYKKAVGG